MKLLLNTALVLAGWALAFWAFVTWRLAPLVTWGEPVDPFAGEIAEFRRELHDWDREG